MGVIDRESRFESWLRRYHPKAENPKRKYRPCEPNIQTNCEFCGKPMTIRASDRRLNRGKYCSQSCQGKSRTIDGKTEQKACKSAVCQALFFHFGKTKREIKVLLGYGNGIHEALTTSPHSKMLRWEVRKYQAEAIAAAEEVLNGSPSAGN